MPLRATEGQYHRILYPSVITPSFNGIPTDL